MTSEWSLPGLPDASVSMAINSAGDRPCARAAVLPTCIKQTTKAIRKSITVFFVPWELVEKTLPEALFTGNISGDDCFMRGDDQQQSLGEIFVTPQDSVRLFDASVTATRDATSSQRAPFDVLPV